MIGQRDLSYRQKRESKTEKGKSPSLITSVVNLVCKLPCWAPLFKKTCETLQVNQQTISLPRLPDAFTGYKILFMSDFHFEITPSPMERLLNVTLPEHDVVILGGDYFDKHEGVERALLKAFVDRFEKPIYAVLGNHDRSELIEMLESLGVHVLMNESAWLTQGDERLLLTGVDDVSQFNSAIQSRVAERSHEWFSGCKIMLSHAPDFLETAANNGYDLQLSGHTHGGQFTLWGYIAFKQTKFPFATAGAWSQKQMKGFTTTGIGSSRYPVRNVVPEMVQITLVGN